MERRVGEGRADLPGAACVAPATAEPLARLEPAAFRAALTRVSPFERDAWLDRVLGLEGPWEDGPALPRGCAPYTPCSVAAALRALDRAAVGADDVFVDLGAGVGRTAMLAHLVTGAASIGVEIQPQLAQVARGLAARVGAAGLSVVEGDAVELTPSLASGTVFFLYCPFSGARFERVLEGLEPIARRRPIRLCCVHLPPPRRPWLTPVGAADDDEVTVYRSTLHA